VLLYDSPVSGNCYKVRLLLAHLGLPYERRTMDVVDRSNRPEVLGGLNPSLRVPTLVLDDGRSLGESGAILWYFGEGTRFVPDDPYSRAQVLQWLFFEQYDHEPNIAVARFWLATRAGPTRPAIGSRAGTRAATVRWRRWRSSSTAGSGSSATR
jgi:glutathione S-transferase